jgi:hypothetical protein
MDIKPTGGERRQMVETALYTVREDKITQREFILRLRLSQSAIFGSSFCVWVRVLSTAEQQNSKVKCRHKTDRVCYCCLNYRHVER